VQPRVRERVAAATEGDGWVSDGAYHQMIGELVFERVETVAWLDLPVRLVMWRLLRRTYLRRKHGTELWHGNREGPWRESVGRRPKQPGRGAFGFEVEIRSVTGKRAPIGSALSRTLAPGASRPGLTQVCDPCYGRLVLGGSTCRKREREQRY
jgi:hypothetical protein